MSKLVVTAILAIVGWAWYQGLIFAPRKPPPQPVQAADPLADMAERLKAEQERLRAEEDARGRNSQPQAAPAAAAYSKGPSRDEWMRDAARRMACSQAQNNVRELEQAAKSGSHVAEFAREGGAKVLGPAHIPAALAENRKAVEEYCKD